MAHFESFLLVWKILIYNLAFEIEVGNQDLRCGAKCTIFTLVFTLTEKSPHSSSPGAVLLIHELQTDNLFPICTHKEYKQVSWKLEDCSKQLQDLYH